MIAFVVVGLFLLQTLFTEDMKTIDEMGGIQYTSTKICFDVFNTGMASVALPTTFNFVGEFTVLYSLSSINVWYAVLGGPSF
jgi:NADH-quinone oxidoreductase subunit M